MLPANLDRMERRTGGRRLEAIYLVYLAFFVLAVATPSIVSQGHFGVSEPIVEEVMIFLFGMGGLLAFLANEKYVELRIRERDQAVANADRAMGQLVESYQYIGSINRQMDLLKRLMNQTSLEVVGKKAYWKDLLQSLAANACAACGAKSVLLRIVDVDKLRTEREVWHHLEGNRGFKVANRELRAMHDGKQPHATISADGHEGPVLVIPSDRPGPTKAYLLIALDEAQAGDADISLLKVFANHAEMVYHLLQRRGAGANALDKVDDVANMSVGEVR